MMSARARQSVRDEATVSTRESVINTIYDVYGIVVDGEDDDVADLRSLVCVCSTLISSGEKPLNR